ncbi:MAG: helix-turn-helix transcriptional regulator [Ruminococcaceae bacterium]|nr:helix-turn-helix transcriptional regulator [Oscillospiraceae bacterium]
MNERIKRLRDSLGLTQEEFGTPLNIVRSTIANYERGVRSLSDRTIADICRVYGVSETWLRTGEGPMLAPKDREDEITDFLASVLRDRPDSFKKRLVATLARLDESEWELLANMARKLADEEKKADPE